MALVGGGANPKWPKTKVIMWDDLEASKFEELNHNQEVMGVRMRPECVIVMIVNRIYLYGIPEFAIIGQIDTNQSMGPVIGLSTDEANFVLALPSTEQGHVILKTSLEQSVEEISIKVHDRGALQAIVVTSDGLLMACCSVNGKRVKIFELTTRTLLRVLRRGFRATLIQSVIFSQNKKSLCVLTDQTIHYFSLLTSE